MSIVETHCPSCSSTVRIDPTKLMVSPPTDWKEAGSCTFVCPECWDRVWLSIDFGQAAMLLRRGAEMTPYARARRDHPSGRARRADPDRRPPGPPLTYDDLLELHFLLEDEDWFSELEALVR